MKLLKRLESLTLFIGGGMAYSYFSNLYKDAGGRYLWHKCSIEEPYGDWEGFNDLGLESEYVASAEVYSAEVFDERDLDEPWYMDDMRWDRMLVLTPQYLVLLC
jgi:hypothetical protein